MEESHFDLKDAAVPDVKAGNSQALHIEHLDSHSAHWAQESPLGRASPGLASAAAMPQQRARHHPPFGSKWG